MKEDDFNFDEFMENSNSDFEMKLEEYKDRMIRLAIETNYAQIEKNGINDWHLRHMDPTELISLNGTFKMMLDYFEENEEYEKCAKIMKQLNTMDSIMSPKRDI